MANKVTIFKNEQFGEIRMTERNGEPWFVLADLCKVLELSNPTMVAKKLDLDERAKSDLGLQERNVTLVNESGMYAVILRSDKPQAKPFRKWVTSEVLPAIRKTGSYKGGVALIEATMNFVKRIRKSERKTRESAPHSFFGKFPRKRTRITSKSSTRELRTF